mgnify:CR=1 FL=1
MQVNPERRAWYILLGSFLIFLLLCGLVLYGAQWFVFRSTVPMRVDLAVARGTVQVLPPNTGDSIAVVDIRTELDPGTVIQTDSTSQATLTFEDSTTGNQLAALVIYRDSRIEIVQARQPRFRFNVAPARVQIQVLGGRAELEVFETSEQQRTMMVETDYATATTQYPGQYQIEANAAWSRVSVPEGQIQIVKTQGGGAITLVAGQTIQINQDATSPLVMSLQESLADNGEFGGSYLDMWQFYNDTETDPPGTTYPDVVDGRNVAVLDRSQSNWPGIQLGHGETGLEQSLNVSMANYNFLEIRANFLVAEQSLSTCGQRGSECPVMLRLEYVDTQGVERTYITGFYAFHDPGVAWPVACDTCRTEHERINLNSWYTYESGNLMDRLPAEQRPATLTSIRVYASGHAYKVFLTSVELIVSK